MSHPKRPPPQHPVHSGHVPPAKRVKHVHELGGPGAQTVCPDHTHPEHATRQNWAIQQCEKHVSTTPHLVPRVTPTSRSSPLRIDQSLPRRVSGSTLVSDALYAVASVGATGEHDAIRDAYKRPCCSASSTTSPLSPHDTSTMDSPLDTCCGTSYSHSLEKERHDGWQWPMHFSDVAADELLHEWNALSVGSGDHSLVQPQMYPFAPSNIRCSLPEVASPLDRCSTASSSTYSDAFSTFTEELAMPARDTSQQPFFSIHHGSDSALTSTYPTLDPNLDIDLGNVIGAPVPAVNSAEFQEALDALVIQIPGTQLSTSLTWNASTSHGDAGETVAPALHGFSRMSDFMQLLRIAHPSCFPDASTSAYSLPQVPAHLAAPSSYCAPPFATPSEMRPPEPAGPILHHPRPFRPDIPEALKNFTRMIEGSASPPSPDIPPAQVGPSIGLGSHGYTLNSTHSLLLQPVAASVRAPHECSENAPHAPYPAAWPQAQMQEDFDMDAALSSLPGGSDAVASHPGEEYALPDWYRCNYGASGMGSW